MRDSDCIFCFRVGGGYVYAIVRPRFAIKYHYRVYHGWCYFFHVQFCWLEFGFRTFPPSWGIFLVIHGYKPWSFSLELPHEIKQSSPDSFRDWFGKPRNEVHEDLWKSYTFRINTRVTCLPSHWPLRWQAGMNPSLFSSLSKWFEAHIRNCSSVELSRHCLEFFQIVAIPSHFSHCLGGCTMDIF